MAAKSSIEWTESTWNPVTGCTKVSSGCQHCYAERMAWRLQAMGNPNYAAGFDVALHQHMLDLPLRWRTPQRIFVNSMSDLFHERVPTGFILQVFGVMRQAHWHNYQVLTKRPERVLELDDLLPWADHIWMGTSVETQDYVLRIDQLRETSAHVKFLSLEPLLGPLDNLDLRGVDWAIVGGESGPGARPMELGWVRSIRDQCAASDTAFFFKQWGGRNKKKAGRHLDGRTWEEMPEMSCGLIPLESV
jgi:protein gp37